MKKLTSPSAILIGFALMSLAILFQPVVSPLLLPSAHAQLGNNYGAIEVRLNDIAKAIFGIRACRD
jgi:hypothetical protein